MRTPRDIQKKRFVAPFFYHRCYLFCFGLGTAFCHSGQSALAMSTEVTPIVGGQTRFRSSAATTNGKSEFTLTGTAATTARAVVDHAWDDGTLDYGLALTGGTRIYDRAAGGVIANGERFYSGSFDFNSMHETSRARIDVLSFAQIDSEPGSGTSANVLQQFPNALLPQATATLYRGHVRARYTLTEDMQIVGRVGFSLFQTRSRVLTVYAAAGVAKDLTETLGVSGELSVTEQRRPGVTTVETSPAAAASYQVSDRTTSSLGASYVYYVNRASQASGSFWTATGVVEWEEERGGATLTAQRSVTPRVDGDVPYYANLAEIKFLHRLQPGLNTTTGASYRKELGSPYPGIEGPYVEGGSVFVNIFKGFFAPDGERPLSGMTATYQYTQFVGVGIRVQEHVVSLGVAVEFR